MSLFEYVQEPTIKGGWLTISLIIACIPALAPVVLDWIDTYYPTGKNLTTKKTARKTCRVRTLKELSKSV